MGYYEIGSFTRDVQTKNTPREGPILVATTFTQHGAHNQAKCLWTNWILQACVNRLVLNKDAIVHCELQKSNAPELRTSWRVMCACLSKWETCKILHTSRAIFVLKSLQFTMSYSNSKTKIAGELMEDYLMCTLNLMCSVILMCTLNLHVRVKIDKEHV